MTERHRPKKITNIRHATNFRKQYPLYYEPAILTDKTIYYNSLLTNKKNTYKIDMDIHKLQKTIAEKVHT